MKMPDADFLIVGQSCTRFTRRSCPLLGCLHVASILIENMPYIRIHAGHSRIGFFNPQSKGFGGLDAFTRWFRFQQDQVKECLVVTHTQGPKPINNWKRNTRKKLLVWKHEISNRIDNFGVTHL